MRILSGLQPTGRLHLGNYFGMMQQAIALQEQGQALYFIADYHALTTISDPAELRDNVFHLAVDFLACGLDPDRAIFFRQSDLPEVTELAWILSCACPMGLLERAHSYKDKVARGLEATHGLFSYPVLMAADILLYDSDLVPVGDDQKQHLEITRDLALKINHRYGEGTLTVPEPRIRAEAAKVPGLDGEKMSKSYGNTVGLFEEEKALRKKIMRIVTDSTPVEEPKPTANSTILQLYEIVAGKQAAAEMADSFQSGGLGYGHYKQQLFEAIRDHFAPMAARRQEFLSKPAAVESILADGAARAKEIARPVLHRLRTAVGLGT
jgi:tryptophanyl-tRNA synthetase